MIRNLLYSICLHILFFLIIFFNDTINNKINREIASLNVVNVSSDFLDNNEIKTTEKDNFPDLSLQEKIDLYNSVKDKNIKLDKTIQNNNTTNIDDLKKMLKNDNSSTYVLYLGPTDYKKYISKIENKKNKENIVKKLEIQKQNNHEEKVQNNLNKILDKIENDNTNKKIYLSNSNNDTIDIKKDLKIDEQKNIKNIEDNENLLFNISADEIFTKNDIKNIQHILADDRKEFSLSAREKINVQNQLISCYKNALIQTGQKSLVKTSVIIKLYIDGIINSKEIKIKVLDNDNKFTKEDYDIAIDNVKLALAYCNPIRGLPVSKYRGWQNINFVFDVVK